MLLNHESNNTVYPDCHIEYAHRKSNDPNFSNEFILEMSMEVAKNL